jgi:hypothetical protein
VRHHCLLLALALAACSGSFDTSTGTTGETPIRRLNKVELLHTLEDLLGSAYHGDWGQVAGRIAPDPEVDGLDTISSAMAPSPSYVTQMQGLIAYVVDDVAIDELAPCPAADASCVTVLLDGPGRRALRRPPGDAERQSYAALYTTLATLEGHQVAMKGLLVRLLTSPDFLYHVAVGDPATGRLTDHEMAARLAYLLWETMPDAELMAAADSGSLTDPADVELALQRMLADPRTQRTLSRFYMGLFRLDEVDGVFKDQAVYPDFAALKPSMQASVERLLADHIASGDLEALLTSPDAYVDDTLAAFLGVAAPGPGQLTRVTLDDTRYAGIMTQPAFMAVLGKSQRSAPIIRGVFVLSRLLCSPTDPPPPGAEVIPPDPPGITTTRAFFASLTSPPSCQGCHARIDPLGFAFEHFDGIGRWREQDNGHPVDATGTFAMSEGDEPLAFDGSVELLRELAGLPEVRRCVVERWFRSRFGRTKSASDVGIVATLDEAFAQEDGRLAGLAAILASTDALYRPHFDLGGK